MCMKMSCDRMSMKSYIFDWMCFYFTADSWMSVTAIIASGPPKTKKKQYEFSCVRVSVVKCHSMVTFMSSSQTGNDLMGRRGDVMACEQGGVRVRVSRVNESQKLRIKWNGNYVFCFFGQPRGRRTFERVCQTKSREIYWANAIGGNVCQINIDTKTVPHSRWWWTSERTLNLCEERNA